MTGQAPDPADPADPRTLGASLRRQREAQGLSQQRLALKAGLSIRTVRNLEVGAGRPHQATLERLLSVLRVDEAVAELLSGTRRPPASGPAPTVAGRRAGTAPAELPADVFAFTGRAPQLRALDRYLLPPTAAPGGDDPAEPADRSSIALVVGPAGVGKTSLAVRWAHGASAHWPDGQLFVDLRGYDPLNPVQSQDALAHLLRGLEVPEKEWPPGLEDRAALFRSAVARARMLLLLDNCASAEQVRPLLPGSTSSAVLVTSRHALSGLVARDGARRLRLDALDHEEAVLLIRRLLDEAEPSEALAELAELCDRLPLALRIAAELVARRSEKNSVETLVAELERHRTRLSRLSNSDDRRTDLSTVFSWSLKHLSEPARGAFIALGLHPGPSFDRHLLAALTDTSTDVAEAAARALAEAHLVLPSDQGRYRMHDLVHEYAHTLMVPEVEASRVGSRRLMAYFVAGATAAVELLYGTPADDPDDDTAPAVTATLTSPEDALSWLRTERDNLESAVRAFASDEPQAAIALSRRLFRYLAGSDPRLALTVHRAALEAAETLADAGAVVATLNDLGTALWQCGDTQTSRNLFLRALEVARDSGDLGGEAQTLLSLGRCEQNMAAAAEWFATALAIFEKLEDLNGQARCLANLGFARERLGDLDEALHRLTQAADLAAASSDHSLEANIAGGLGEIARRAGDHISALQHHQRALAVFRLLGDRQRSAWALHSVGTDLRETGDHQAATTHELAALELFEELSDPTGQAHALNGLGETHLMRDAADAARDCFERVLELGEVVADRDQLARAHAGLMDAKALLGHLQAARDHGTQASSLYDALGRPEKETVEIRLRALI